MPASWRGAVCGLLSPGPSPPRRRRGEPKPGARLPRVALSDSLTRGYNQATPIGVLDALARGKRELCLPSLQHDPNRLEDVLKVDADEDGVGGDDAADCLRYLVETKQRKVTQRKLRGL